VLHGGNGRGSWGLTHGNSNCGSVLTALHFSSHPCNKRFDVVSLLRCESLCIFTYRFALASLRVLQELNASQVLAEPSGML